MYIGWWLSTATALAQESAGTEQDAGSGDQPASPWETPAPPSEPPPAPPSEPTPSVAPPLVTPSPPLPTLGPTRGDRLFGLNGEQWTLAYGAALGAFAGGTSAYLVQGEEGEPISLATLAGFGAGGATTWLLIQSQPPTVDQAMHLGSSGVLGTFAGYRLARALIPEGAAEEQRRIAAAGLLGATAGTGIGMLTFSRAPVREQTFALDVGAFIGWQAGAGAAATAGHGFLDDPRTSAAASLGGATVFGATAVGLYRAGLPRPEVDLLGVSLAQGAWLGVWTPFVVADDPDAVAVWGALRLGLGAGYLGAQVAAPFVEQSPTSTALQVAGMASGSALGAGIPLAMGQTDRRPVLLTMMGGSVGGQVLGAALAPRYELSEQDYLTLGLLETWTAWQGLGWAFAGGNAGLPGSQAAGVGLAIGGGGTVASMALMPALELTPEQNALLATGAVWGTWTGLWGTQLWSAQPEEVSAGTLLLGNIGLVGAGVADAVWEPTWQDVGIINGVGALGGALGGLGGVILFYNPQDLRPVAGASVVGSTLGLGAGALIAVRRQDPPTPLGLLPGLPDRRELPVVLGFSAAPWTDEQGNPGWSVQLSGVERE